MENKDKIYDQFKEAATKAEDKGFDRMDAVWNRVEEKLDNKKRRRGVLWFKYAGIAAALLLFMGLATYMLNKNETIITPQTLPKNNVTVIDTQKVKETFAPDKEEISKVAIDDSKKNKGIKKVTVIEADSIHFEAKSKKSLVWNNRKDEGEFRVKGEITKREVTQGDAKSASPIPTPQGLPFAFFPVGNSDEDKNDDSVAFMKKSKFTTSKDADNPEYYFETNKLKLVPGKKTVAGVTNMAVAEESINKSLTPKYYVTYTPLADKFENVNTIGYGSVTSQTPDKKFGGNKSIVLRGNGSINAGADPLYIINGVPYNSESFRRVKPSFYESVEVLKGTAATSLYGTSGANGVVIIKTKKLNRKQRRELRKSLQVDPKTVQVIHDAAIDFATNKKITVDQEEYDSFEENKFEDPATAPLSTFSIDVDNASYTNVRRFINNGQTVPKDAVRVEEIINFFKYQYPQPKGHDPFSINTEYSEAPWNPNHKLLKIGLQGKDIPTADLPASNFVFLIDVSGSMNADNKLPLLKQSMKLLVNQMRPKDKLAIVVYAGAAGLVLPATSGFEKSKIIEALENLSAGGSTAGGEGIELAYKIAQENFIKGGNNRVILATDGDFNVGASRNSDMQTLIEEKRKGGVFLTCLGYGMGNYKDSKLETLADKGNGNYAYIDNMQEANRFLDKEFKGSMYAIAKDVKIQIEFNPKLVQSYRLIGYENRKLGDEDFVNDAIDAGELGSGHTVTALYEIIPVGIKSDYTNTTTELKYSTPQQAPGNYNNELATIKFRHKKPDSDKSTEIVKVIPNTSVKLNTASPDFKFAAAVAWFGLKLRDSKLIPNKTSADIKELAKQGSQNDPDGYRAEFIRLVEMIN